MRIYMRMFEVYEERDTRDLLVLLPFFETCLSFQVDITPYNYDYDYL